MKPNKLRSPAPAHWRDRSWAYQPAASHVDSLAFRARQEARKAQLQNAARNSK
jgi:hypothetical protein